MSKSTTPKTWPAKVRTTVTPTEVVEVTEREYVDLLRQGLIFDGTAAEAKAAQTGDGPAVDLYTPSSEGDNEKKEA